MTERSGKMRVSANLLSLAAAVGLVGICAAQSSASAQGVTSAASPKPPLKITLRLLNDSVKVGNPVLLKVTITNEAKERMLVDVRDATWLMGIDVRDSQGDRPLTRRGRILYHLDPGIENELPIDNGGQSAELYPGKTVVVSSIPVPDLYDLSQPGSYTIQVQRPDGHGGNVKSNTVTVTIVP
ncbi:MAG: hypothetical protein ACLPTQ_08640 [Terriglobales bacterium]|jgi:hypothetical protein